MQQNSSSTLSAKNYKKELGDIHLTCSATANTAQGNAGKLLLNKFTKAESTFLEKQFSDIIGFGGFFCNSTNCRVLALDLLHISSLICNHVQLHTDIGLYVALR